MELAELAIKIDSRDAKTAEDDLKRLSDTGARTERSLEGVGAGGKEAARGSDATARSSRDAAREMDRHDNAAKRLTASVRYFAVASLAAGAAVVAWAGSMTRSMDNASKFAQQIGIGVEELTSMRFAVQQFANVSDQTFDMSLRRMTRRIEEAAQGTGAAKNALDAMGLSARELSSLSADQQFLAIADAMERTESQAQRLQYAMSLLDTEGMVLVPALQQGSEALRDAAEMARRFGVVLSEDLAEAAEKFTTNMSLLSSVQQGYRQEVAEHVLPALVSLTDRIVEFAKEAGPASERVEKALTALGVAATATASVIAGRLVGSITASVVSWIAATAAAVRHQMQLVRLTASIAGASAAMTGLSAAASGAMTVMTRAVGGLSVVMGGPLGVITATGLAATAFLTMGRNASAASVDVDELSRSLDGLSARQLRIAAFNLENELVELSKQAEGHGQILRGLNNDYQALSGAQGVTEEGLRNVGQAIDEEEEALSSATEEIAKKTTALGQINRRLQELDGAARGAAGGIQALNQAMGFSEPGERFLGQLQERIKALQDGNDPIKVATRWVSEHTDATEADKAAIMSAAHALKALQDAQTRAAQAARGATKVMTDAQRTAQALTRERQQALRAQHSAISAIHDEADALETQVALFGLGKTAIEDLTIARLEEQATILRGFDGSEEQVAIIEREIEARRRLRTAIGSLEQKEAEKAAWEDWSRDVEQIFDRVGQSLTDAIFDGGKSGKDLLRDMFKGLTFNILINPVMNQMQGWVTNQLGGLFGMQNPQQGGGMFGLAQNASSLHSAFTGGFTDTLAGGINWLGEQFGSSALQSFAAGMTGTATVASTTLGAATMVPGLGVGLTGGAAAGGGLVSGAAGLVPGLGVGTSGGAAVAGGAMSGAAGGAASAGSLLATAAPWVMGGLAVASAFGLFDDRLPTTRRSKQGASHMLPDGTFEISAYDDRQSSESQEAARLFAEQAVKSANDLFARAGVDAAIHGFQTLMESSILGDRQGVGSSGQVRVGDEIVDIGLAVESSWTKHGFGGWSDADMLPRLQTDIQLTLLEAFQAAGDAMPNVLAEMLEGIDIRSLGAEQAQALAQSFQIVIDQVSAFQAAVELLPFANLRDLSFDAAANLISFAGGLEALDQGMTTYFQNFYSEAEQLDFLSSQISGALDELGLAMPDVTQGAQEARAAYRSLVESLDLNTEEGQRAYATLMTLSGGFAELTSGMDELARSSGDAATRFDSLINSFMGMASEALSAVQQRGQERIAQLSESFAQTDAVMSAVRSRVQQVESQWSSLMTSMERSMRDLRGQVEVSARLQYDQARAVISTALLTGQMPQTADLGEAIRTAQQGVTGGRYASAFDQREAYLKLANDLEDLQAIAKPELDTARATLEQLEKQYNRIRGIEDYSDKSLTQLERQLASALSTEESARIQIAAIERQISMAQLQYQQLVGINEELSTLPGALNALANAVNAATAAREAAGKSQSGVSRETQYLANNPDVLDAYLRGQGGSMSAEELARYHYDKYGRNEGRSFDVGTPYVPYDMTANIHRGEIIIDPRSSDILRRYGIEVQGGGSRETEQLLREQLAEVRQQNRYLYEIVKSGKRTERNTEDLSMAVAHNPSDDVVVVF